MTSRLYNIKRNARAILNRGTPTVVLNEAWVDTVSKLCDELISARAIMQKFVNKVDTGRARSTETYREMKEWLDG